MCLAFRPLCLRYGEAEGEPQAPVRFVYALEKHETTPLLLVEVHTRLRSTGNDSGLVCNEQLGQGDPQRSAPSFQYLNRRSSVATLDMRNIGAGQS